MSLALKQPEIPCYTIICKIFFSFFLFFFLCELWGIPSPSHYYFYSVLYTHLQVLVEIIFVPIKALIWHRDHTALQVAFLPLGEFVSFFFLHLSFEDSSVLNSGTTWLPGLLCMILYGICWRHIWCHHCPWFLSWCGEPALHTESVLAALRLYWLRDSKSAAAYL